MTSIAVLFERQTTEKSIHSRIAYGRRICQSTQCGSTKEWIYNFQNDGRSLSRDTKELYDIIPSLAPSHELLQNLTSLYNQICKLLVMCRQWLNRCIFFSLTDTVTSKGPSLHLPGFTYVSFPQGRPIFVPNTASSQQELWAPPQSGMGLRDSSLKHYFFASSENSVCEL